TEAIRLRGTKLTAGDAGLYFTRANLYLAHAETDRALADYDQAIRLNPKPAWHYHNRGLAHARKEQWDRAIADFAKAKELAGAGKHVALNGLANRANVLAMAGRIPEAEAGYEESLEFDPSRLPDLLVGRAWFVDRRRGDYGGALEKLDEAAKSGMIW